MRSAKVGQQGLPRFTGDHQVDQKDGILPLRHTGSNCSNPSKILSAGGRININQSIWPVILPFKCLETNNYTGLTCVHMCVSICAMYDPVKGRKTHLFDTNQGKKFTNQSSPPKTRPKRSAISSTKKMVVDSQHLGATPKMVGFPNNPWGFPYIKYDQHLGACKLGVYTHHFFRKHPSFPIINLCLGNLKKGKMIASILPWVCICKELFSGEDMLVFQGGQKTQIHPIFFTSFWPQLLGSWALKFRSCPFVVITVLTG